MSDSRTVKLGIIGLGSMGAHHARHLLAGEVKNVRLCAVCDIDESLIRPYEKLLCFTDYREMLDSGEVDAVLVATLHYHHIPIGIAAIRAGIHVLVEKPLGVHKNDCRQLNSVYERRNRDDLVFALMFNQRTRSVYRKLKSIIDSGELGRIQRVNWIITDWFRSEHYYNSGGWRATWEGEGGGVLINQCPHQLDLMQWLFGMPKRVHAFGTLGKYHDIEVEDDITAYLDYEDGKTGVFIASTGEAPGTNRLEIASERGRVVVEDNRINWIRNEVEVSRFSKETHLRFGAPDTWDIHVKTADDGKQEHMAVIEAFAAAIMKQGDPIAHGTEGIHSVELGNAMLLSMLKGSGVDLPLDGDRYEEVLNGLRSKSRYNPVSGKTASPADQDEMGASF